MGGALQFIHLTPVPSGHFPKYCSYTGINIKGGKNFLSKKTPGFATLTTNLLAIKSKCTYKCMILTYLKQISPTWSDVKCDFSPPGYNKQTKRFGQVY